MATMRHPPGWLTPLQRLHPASIEAPTTANSRSMPRWSTSRFGSRPSRMVKRGRRAGCPAGAGRGRVSIASTATMQSRLGRAARLADPDVEAMVRAADRRQRQHTPSGRRGPPVT
jgi:hypothetical protein